MDKITVVCVAATGHVLGLLTRVGDPNAEPAVQDLVGDLFTVRDQQGKLVVGIEARHLKTARVTEISDLFINVQQCRVVDKAVVVESQAITGTPPVTVNASGIAIDLGTAAVDDTAVWCQLSAESEDSTSEPLVGKIPKGEKTLKVNRTLLPGEYDALLLVPGFVPHVSHETV